MNIRRLSRDYERIRCYVFGIASKRIEKKDIPGHYWKWIEHLFMVKSLLEIGPSVSAFLSWEEFKGLELIQDAIREIEKMIICPHCKQKTRTGFTCDRCGKKLEA